MNCKPNQRAIVTRTLGVKGAEHYLGMVFTVRYITGVTPAGRIWAVDPDNRHPISDGKFKKGDPILYCADAVLTPLPDDPDAPKQEVTDREIEHA